MRVPTSLLAAALGLAVLAGCSSARSTQPSVGACVGCHGGTDNQTGAPPVDVSGHTTRSSPGVGAHTAHIQAGLLCEACHQGHVPDQIKFPHHMDGVVDVVFSALAAQGLPAAPTYAGAGRTCAVYCHGPRTEAGLALGGALTTPSWTGGPLDCQSCHASPPPISPHEAGMALTSCAGCHPTTVDAQGHIVKGGTHVDGTVNVTGGACTACHGDSSRTADSATLQAAPPLDTHGHTASAQVGAHQVHLHPSPLARAFQCKECHVVPSDTSHANQVAGDAKVQFGGPLGAKGTTPSFAGGTCSNVYCHGATLGGGTKKVTGVIWSGGPLQAACGTCHGFPPPAPHPAVSSTLVTCNGCHPGTVSASGVINIAAHVDGTVESVTAHPVPYQPSVHGPDALADLATCQTCHGTDFGTVVNVVKGTSCNACHQSPTAFGYTGASHADWRSECTFCHGDAGRTPDATFPQVGAVGVNAIRANLAGPPLSPTITGLATAPGAHLAHFSNDPGGNTLSAPIVCTQCHGDPLPSDVTHVLAGTVAIGWGLLPSQGVTPTPAGPITIGTPVTCANYCHGATLQGGTHTTPLWTGGAAEVSCQTCHASPYPYTAAGGYHVQNANCTQCHPGYSTSAPLTAGARATHVNGTVDVTPASNPCETCHSQGSTPWIDTTGATSGPRAGAHATHVTANGVATPLDCTACHPSPGSPQHANGQVDIAWGTLASTGTTPTPPGPIATGAATVTCANYCHGARVSGGANKTPSWTQTFAPATLCGNCHGFTNGAGGSTLPVGHLVGLHASLECTGCHGSVAAVGNTIANLALHMDGTIEVQPNLSVSPGASFTKTAPTRYSCSAPAVNCHGPADATHAFTGW